MRAGFICQGCQRHEKEVPCNHLCDYCSGQFRAIMRLYSEAAAQRLKVRALSVAEFVARLWEKYDKTKAG